MMTCQDGVMKRTDTRTIGRSIAEMIVKVIYHQNHGGETRKGWGKGSMQNNQLIRKPRSLSKQTVLAPSILPDEPQKRTDQQSSHDRGKYYRENYNMVM